MEGFRFEKSRYGNEIIPTEEVQYNPFEEYDPNRTDLITNRDTKKAHEYVEMNALGNNRVDDNTLGVEETSFGGTVNQPDDNELEWDDWGFRTDNQSDTIDYEESVNIMLNNGDTVTRRRVHEYVTDLFTNILNIGDCADPDFIDYLIDGEILSIEIKPGTASDYRVRYFNREFETADRSVDIDTKIIRGDIREHYDEWGKRLHREDVKRAGVIVGIGLSIAAIVSGLALGLTRGGSDVIHAGKKRRKWEKLNPAKVSIPWSDIEEAGGDVLVFTGKYLTVILAVSAVYLTARR